MQKDHSKIMEKMFGKPITSETISISGLKETVDVVFYDGFTIGTTPSGKKVQIEAPMSTFIKTCPELLSKLVDEHKELNSADEVSPVQITQTYGRIFVDGVLMQTK